MVEGASAGASDSLEDFRGFTVSDAEKSIVAKRRETLGRKNSMLGTAIVIAGIGGENALRFLFYGCR